MSNLDSTNPEFQAYVKQASGSTGHLLPLRLDWPPSSNPVTLVIARDVADEIFKNANTTVADVASKISRTQTPKAVDLGDLPVKAEFESFPPLESENVVAILPGSDPELQKEFVVVSAHHDHLGTDSTLAGHQIYNGAADDGSGTVALLEMASAFAHAKSEGAGPCRSLVFLHTTGEKSGLLGSTYFVDREPLVPLDAVTADLNLDGIAGFDPKHPRQSKNYLYVVVGPTEMSDVVARAQKLMPNSIEIDPHEDFSSDNRSFWRHQIPFIYYSTGFVKDYHQPSDQADAIDYEQFARAAQISFATAWELANQPHAIPHKPQSELKLVGYVCPPCDLPCDDEIHNTPGSCPICGMTLVEKFT